MITIGDLITNTNLVIKLPSRGATNWAADFKSEFANKIVEHDHTSQKGVRIKNAALVTTDMVAEQAYWVDADLNYNYYTDSDVSVSTNTIQNNAVTDIKLSSSPTNDSLRAVSTDHIKDNSVDETKVTSSASIDSDRAIGSNHIKDGSISTRHLANDIVVDASKIDNMFLNDLVNVDVTGAVIGSVLALKYHPIGEQDYNWVPASAGATIINSQTDLDNYVPTEGDIVIIDFQANTTYTTNADFNFVNIHVKGGNNYKYLNFTGAMDNCTISAVGVRISITHPTGSGLVTYTKNNIDCLDITIGGTGADSLDIQQFTYCTFKCSATFEIDFNTGSGGSSIYHLLQNSTLECNYLTIGSALGNAQGSNFTLDNCIFKVFTYLRGDLNIEGTRTNGYIHATDGITTASIHLNNFLEYDYVPFGWNPGKLHFLNGKVYSEGSTSVGILNPTTVTTPAFNPFTIPLDDISTSNQVFDTTNAFDISTSTYKVPATGLYEICMQGQVFNLDHTQYWHSVQLDITDKNNNTVSTPSPGLGSYRSTPYTLPGAGTPSMLIDFKDIIYLEAGSSILFQSITSQPANVTSYDLIYTTFKTTIRQLKDY